MPGRSHLRAGVAVAALAAVLVSPHLGQADPAGSYRPDLPPDALTSGCYPLPDGVQIDQAVLPHQVRTDGDVDGRRVLVAHWDLVDEATAQARLVGAFEAAGYETTAASAGHVELDGAAGPVDIDLAPIPELPADSTVRGSFTLDLPVVGLAPGREEDEDCLNPFSTKRFP